MNSQNIENKLAECLEIMETTSQTAEQAVSMFPENQTEILEMLHDIEQIKSIDIPGPSTEFITTTRTRLMN